MEMFDPVQNFFLSLSPILVLSVIVLLILTSLFTPLFIWGIYNQTRKTARELQRLNHQFDQLVLPVRTRKQFKKHESKHEPSRSENEESEIFLTPVSKRFKE